MIKSMLGKEDDPASLLGQGWLFRAKLAVKLWGGVRKNLGGGNSNIFYFHSYLGKWSNLTNIFQSWNHQLEMDDRCWRYLFFSVWAWAPLLGWIPQEATEFMTLFLFLNSCFPWRSKAKQRKVFRMIHGARIPNYQWAKFGLWTSWVY